MTDWKLVPKKPTIDMTEAGSCHVMRGMDYERAQATYGAMLAQAPRPVATDEDVERVAKALCDRAHGLTEEDTGYPLWREFWDEACVALGAMGYEVEGDE